MLLQRTVKNIMACFLGLFLSLLMMGGFILFFSKSGIILNQNAKNDAFLYIKDDLLGYTLLPNQKVTGQDAEGDFTFSINNIGFRDTLFDPLDDFRQCEKIMFLGDSFTLGGAVRLPYPQIVELKSQSMLNCPIKAFNFGNPGYGTINENAVLHKYGPCIRPNVVILGFFLGNDFHDNIIPLDSINVLHGYLTYNIITWSTYRTLLSNDDLNRYVDIAINKGLSPYSLAQLIRVDKFGNQMTFVERTTRQLGINFPAVKTVIDFIKAKLSMNSIVSFGITTPAYYRATEEEARITREYLMKIKNKCRELDAELILVMIPEHIGNYDNADKRETLKGLCAEAGITRTIDLFPLFKDALDEVYLEYDGHFSQKGHQALADILVDYMLDHNLIARGEPTGK